MTVRLFHFSHDSSINEFIPRLVKTPSPRAPGFEWLNGSLVWAIDDWHQPMYLFPRDCPRILLWSTPATTKEDLQQFFGASKARMLAYIEERWAEMLKQVTIYRYELPIETFTFLDDASMWVSQSAVRPIHRIVLNDLHIRLEEERVELRILPTLAPLRRVWDTSLHISGIRLRNARDWNPPET